MNAVSNALMRISHSIPKDILEKVFLSKNRFDPKAATSLNEHILATVLRPRVFVDCDIVGGTETLIRVDSYLVGRLDDYTTVYRIPKSATQNRSILSVLNVSFADPSRISHYGTALGGQNTQMLSTAHGLIDAAGTIPVTSTAIVQLIGENVVSVRDSTVMPGNCFLRCVLSSDENFSHLQLRSYRRFAELCVLATKAYIYKNQVLEIDVTELSGGFQLGRFKEIVDSYADAEELYDTMLREVWGKVSLMNDTESWSRLLRGVIGGHR